MKEESAMLKFLIAISFYIIIFVIFTCACNLFEDAKQILLKFMGSQENLKLSKSYMKFANWYIKKIYLTEYLYIYIFCCHFTYTCWWFINGRSQGLKYLIEQATIELPWVIIAYAIFFTPRIILQALGKDCEFLNDEQSNNNIIAKISLVLGWTYYFLAFFLEEYYGDINSWSWEPAANINGIIFVTPAISITLLLIGKYYYYLKMLFTNQVKSPSQYRGNFEMIVKYKAISSSILWIMLIIGSCYIIIFCKEVNLTEILQAKTFGLALEKFLSIFEDKPFTIITCIYMAISYVLYKYIYRKPFRDIFTKAFSSIEIDFNEELELQHYERLKFELFEPSSIYYIGQWAMFQRRI